MRYGPCAKVNVTAILLHDGRVIAIGTNWCRKPQKKCPRDEQGYAPGEGYHLCKEICDQPNHAETDALLAAWLTTMAQPDTCIVLNQTRVCENCKQQLKKAGVKHVWVASVHEEL